MDESPTQSYSRELAHEYPSFRSDAFARRAFPPETLTHAVDALERKWPGRVRIGTPGRSFEGRPIRLFSIGSGSTRVLLWSQMHGDESTATMAMVDILAYLLETGERERTGRILSTLTLQFLPMLNPDGAARFQRRTAQCIDMNRDALALQTPEARILRDLQREFRPAIGFNLHDQALSTVGASRDISALSLLAPALDPARTVNGVRKKALRIAATFARVMESFASGKISRYDDTFEPRAFGDNMQMWGTSTVLVESGHVPGDPEKNEVRTLNFIGILSCLDGIARGEDGQADTAPYDGLPFNAERAYDLIIRNVKIDHGERRSTGADLGITWQVDTHSEPPPKLADVGDLQSFAGLREIDGTGRSIAASLLSVGDAFDWEKYFPPA